MKATVISILAAGLLIGGAIMLSYDSKDGGNEDITANNVSTESGKQVVSISAKGGYTPNISTAKADVPTTLRVETNGTFDCSSALTIPSIGYRVYLPPSGVTEVDVPAQKQGTILRGLCAMGMYNFEVRFN